MNDVNEKKSLSENEAKKEEVKTEVTSIAKEEKKTGTKIEVPSEEELLARASQSFFNNRMVLSKLYPRLSSKGKTRVMNAILDLPTEDIPVKLKGNDEKLAFALGQRIISDRFVVTQYHINQEIRKLKKQKEASNKSEEKVEEK